MTLQPFLTIPYPIFVGHGLLDRVGSLVKARGRVFVITSDALRGRFGERVAASFPEAGIIAFEEGEAHKTLATAEAIITELLERGAKRDSMAVVVGGGMIGDTAGFAASIFLRGIDLVHVPTTLLAQVDSSIGGKVAVNHPKGKNLIGSFHPPAAVVSDIDVLETLPHRERLSGLFEALKGGVIADPELFAMFEERRVDTEEVVRRAIKVKADIVAADEREADLRRLLNYGHTIAHGIEAAMHYEGITHGEAVAWGMIGANAIAARRGLLAEEEQARIDGTIRAYEPMPLPALDAEEIVAATEHDKKNTGRERVMVLPHAVGDVRVTADIGDEELLYGVEAIL
ncbi:MAG TPA: 3-dehydroquinate synthase [Thermoanaerobaculia bacterium]|nr:3-dehydroquinate synthase [Thermoanaerobaculia bacterium]